VSSSAWEDAENNSLEYRLVPAEERPPENPHDPVISVPQTEDLEKGKYYLQLASFSREEGAELVVSKIENELPVRIIDAEVAGQRVYRVLVGPLSLGEAGVLLQSFRGSYADAFVRFIE
jgi:cell division protein FtsN